MPARLLPCRACRLQPDKRYALLLRCRFRGYATLLLRCAGLRAAAICHAMPPFRRELMLSLAVALRCRCASAIRLFLPAPDFRRHATQPLRELFTLTCAMLKRHYHATMLPLAAAALRVYSDAQHTPFLRRRRCRYFITIFDATRCCCYARAYAYMRPAISATLELDTLRCITTMLRHARRFHYLFIFSLILFCHYAIILLFHVIIITLTCHAAFAAAAAISLPLRCCHRH